MALTSGTRFGSYEIIAPLGAGGMGEVYRARDTNLKRDVAIKVLPAALASDGERLARFQREAELLAALNHPNIAQIYGLERSDGTTALVMELVSGQTLAERFAHGALSVEEALAIARQITDALEAAHERGIVHRDLKPANVQLTPDGTVKVLDFGIAKALDTRTTGPGPAALTTPAMTDAGIVLGTAAYMSPEQARGKPVDQRADIWAFGCMLYELLTGQLAFGGDDVTLVLARVLERSPDFGVLPKATPPAVRRTLELCLEKDPKKRIADIRDVKLALAGAFGSTVVNAARSPWWRTRAALAAVTGVAALSLGSVAWLISRPAAAPFPETHVEIDTPGTATPTAFAISADGRRVVYSAPEEGRAFLWARSLDGGVPTRLEGTEDAVTPFWSPDGRSLGFFRDRALKVIDVGSGAIRELAQAADGRGGSWNGQGDVLFAPTSVGGILRVSAQGGERVTVTELTPGQRSHGFPVFLPNGRDFLFFAAGSEVGGVYAGSLGESEPKKVIDADGPAAYASGHLIYPRQGRLFAQPFDLDSLSAIGEAISVEGFAGDAERNVIAVTASATGVVVYRTEVAGTGGRRLAWFDRSGTEISSVQGGDRGGPFALAPVEGRMAISRTAGGNTDIWMIDLRRGASSRFTTAASLDTHPLFSADGSRLVYQRFFTDRGVIGIVWRPVSGGEEEPLIEGMRGVIPTDVSHDGELLLFKSQEDVGGSRGWDIWALPLSGDRTPIPAVVTPFDERDGQFSPDAAWLVYQSDESGPFEVYLQPFGRAGERVQVSVGGGAQARWRADGREIFYVALDGRLMAVSVQPSADASAAPTLGRPEPLFATNMGPVVPAIARQWYVPSPDGQRFLMGVVDATSASPLEVILNFNPAQRP